jgi:hypothetical protein
VKDFQAAAVERLAECLYVLDRVENKWIDADEARAEWASDDLLTETYRDFEQAARVAIHAEMQRS